MADAAATAVCNRVSHEKDIDAAIEYGKTVEGVEGILIVVGDTLGTWGGIKLVDI